MDDQVGGDVGVATALGRICALEAKLRQAIQHTHHLSSTFNSDPAAADKEREALLAIRQGSQTAGPMSLNHFRAKLCCTWHLATPSCLLCAAENS